jgi:hypothetical protein
MEKLKTLLAPSPCLSHRARSFAFAGAIAVGPTFDWR